MSSISTSELQQRLDEPGADRRRHPAARRLQRLAHQRRATRRPHPGRRRLPRGVADDRGRSGDRPAPRDQGDHRRSRDRRLRRWTGRYDGICRCPPSPRHRDRERSCRRRGRLGRRRDAAARASPALRGPRPHPVAPRRARRPEPRGAAERCVPPLPRQLRGSRGVRGGPYPGRALPRHQLARGPGRLEPPVARGDRGRPGLARHHPRHHGRALRPRHRGRRQREVARAVGRDRSRRPAR